MCRVLIYLGEQEAAMYDLIYGPDNSLAHQSYAPQLMKYIQNLAGFGFCAWSRESEQADMPFFYKTTQLPFFDKNLYRLSRKINTNCLLAHVRGVEYSTEEVVSEQNAHPFMIEGSKIAFAHNGNLAQMALMKRELTPFIRPDVYSQIAGTTDSEWIYALFVSQLHNFMDDVSLDEATEALLSTFWIIKKIRKKLGIIEPSPVNLFITNGHFLIVTRFVYDFGLTVDKAQSAFLEYHSLWVTFGEKYGFWDGQFKMYGEGERKNILFASEPLTTNHTEWVELPEYSMTSAWIENGRVFFKTRDLIF